MPDHHPDYERPDGRAGEARYGPGGAASIRRRQQLAERAAARGAVRSKPRRARPAAAPLLTPLRRIVILWALGFAAVGSVTAIVFFSPLTRVRQVRLTGLSALQPDEASRTTALTAVRPGTNLYRMRPAEIEAKLERLPWVGSATASRQFPDRLVIDIKPRAVLASLLTGGGEWEVDAVGTVIRAARSSADIPVIVSPAAKELKPGQRADADGLAGALRVIERCRPAGGVRVAKIDVDQSGELCLNMSDNVAIRLGRQEQLPVKIDCIHRIYDDKPGIGSEVQSIDLRWPESPSCVYRNGSTARTNETTQSAPLTTGDRSEPSGRD